MEDNTKYNVQVAALCCSPLLQNNCSLPPSLPPTGRGVSYVGSADSTSQNLLAATSTTGLILEDRPK